MKWRDVFSGRHVDSMKWGVILSGWLVLAFLFGARDVVEARLREGEVSWQGVALTVSGILTWMALTPLIFWVARRYPLGHGDWRRSLVAHLVAMVPIILLDIGAFFLLGRFVLKPVSWKMLAALDFDRHFMFVLVSTLPLSIFYYGATVGLSLAFDYSRIVRERELAASQLETRLAQAHLQVLRMQLQPHFLFNTLNAISALLHEDPLAADRMITRLSDLLRLTLAYQGQQEVRLKEELELLSNYVEIEQTRFRDRLTVKEEVAPETLDGFVPSLMLQPLVENAVRHGIQPRSGAGRIEIEARLAGPKLHIEIRDDGRGLPFKDGRAREGVGLANTRARLKALYGSDHRFEVANRPGGGVRVLVEVPFRSEPHEADDAAAGGAAQRR